MKKIILIAMAMMPCAMFAQETYENANIVTEDLNGTARYVGMGGALEALGADISTISTNPAGVGTIRRSGLSVTAGMVSQADAADSKLGDATHASFDQVGLVYVFDLGRGRRINWGFNYHKDRNYNSLLSVSNSLNNASLDKLSAVKGYEGVYDPYFEKNGDVVVMLADGNGFNQLDYLYGNVLGTYWVDDNNNVYWDNYNGQDYILNRATTGSTGVYDLNVSGNVSDNLYLGVTLGIKDVDFRQRTEYTEGLLDGSTYIGDMVVDDYREITGTGTNLKFGAIYQPINDSPFRVGAYIHTPTWYYLNTYNQTNLYNQLDKNYGFFDDGESHESYDYRVNGPWKFGLSAGHVLANTIVLGASYEYADYGATKTRILDDDYNDYYVGGSSYNDENMNYHTKQTLKGVSTLKLGAEVYPTENWAVRLGYNYVSAMYDKDGYKDGSIDSPGSFYASQADYTNWGATNRITCGFGYSKNGFGFDVAYQFSATSGEFTPFMSYIGDGPSDPNRWVSDIVKVKNNRHQLIATLSYKF